MPSAFIQRQIDDLLEDAAQAIKASDWAAVTARSRSILALDPGNSDAQELLAAAERADPTEGSLSSLRNVSQTVTKNSELVNEPPASFASGRYSVKEFLGEGGKKRVYLAHDTLLDRDVAFALIKTEGLDNVGRDRISREAKAMGRLGAHPHIVSVFDLGEESGQPYIVTELMSGGDVEGLIERAPKHRPPLERTLEIAVEVCRGLEFAHEHGIVHRDLKPGNVWLTEDGRAKIGDFGLAVALDKSRLTQAGMMVGTVSYMPPEQAMGGEVTPRSDLYSLGAMLYELVTGRPPFVGDESVAIITQHLNAQPVAPSWHNAAVPPALEALILRLLDKDPAQRPSRSEEVREALEHIRPTTSQVRVEQAAVPPTAENPMYRRAFVGREAELRQLQAAYDAAVSGQGGLVMVVGEPGIGKTSITEQLVTYATIRGGKSLVGHCYEEGSLSLPYLPFVEALRTYVLAREPEDLRRDLGTGAGEVARIVSEIRDRLNVELPPAGAPEDDRWRLLQAVTSFIQNASTVQPLVIIVEDLHDADRGTLDLLTHLSRHLRGLRLLIIGTYRDVEVDRAHPLSSTLAELRRGQSFLRVPLRGLTAEEVQRMMAAVAQRDIPWPMAELVHRQTEGNPLFVQEVLRYLVEEGLVAERGTSLRRVGEDSLAGRIPEGLRDVIGKRLSRLSAKSNEVLSVASVIGREFRLDVLQRVASLSDDELFSALKEATAAAAIEERAAVAGVASYRFTHAFFRQTLYEETIAPLRIRLHQQVARTLEAVYGKRSDEHASELAEHYAYSTDPADLAKAVSYGALAAERAMHVFAYGEAERHLEQALKVQNVLDPDDGARRCDLLLLLGEAMLSAEEPSRAAAFAAPEAYAIAESLHDATRSARAALLAQDGLIRGALAVFYREPEGQEWAERADRWAPEGSRERICADTYLGVQTLNRTGPVEGHRYLRRAAEAALRSDDGQAFFLAGAWALTNLNALRDRDLKEAIAAEVLRRPRAGARRSDLGRSLLMTGWLLLGRGEREAAEALWRELEEHAARTRDSSVSVTAREPMLVRAFLDGRLEDVVFICDETIELVERLGAAPGTTITFVFLKAMSLAYRGLVEQALEEPFFARPGRPSSSARAVLLGYAGRYQEVDAIRQRFGDVASQSDESGVSVLSKLLEASILTRDVDTATGIARRLEILAGRLSAFDHPVSVSRLLGGASVLAGDGGTARICYETALALAHRIRFRPELGLAHLALAELLLDHYADERTTAIEHLDLAITEFRDMKMQPSLERALRHKEVLKA
jgi:hypothetical protein